MREPEILSKKMTSSSSIESLSVSLAEIRDALNCFSAVLDVCPKANADVVLASVAESWDWKCGHYRFLQHWRSEFPGLW